MAANPSGFDYFRRGELFPALNKSASGSTGFDYFRHREPFVAIIAVSVTVDSIRPRTVVISTDIISSTNMEV